MLLTTKLVKFFAGLGIVLSILAGCSSSDPTNVAADFSAQGIKGKIEGEIVVIDLSDLGNCATTIENMTIAAETFGASVSPDPRVARDYTNPVEFTVTAPDGTKAVFKVKVKGAGCLSTPAPKPNTPLVLGKLSCTPVQFAPFEVNQVAETTVNCEITATDPDGIKSFAFTLSDDSPSVYPDSIKKTTDASPTYSVEISCSKTFNRQDITLTFTATGAKPDGSSESPQTATNVLFTGDICPER